MTGLRGKPLRTVLVGFGRQAELAHLPALLANESGFELVGCVDISPARCTRASRLCPGVTTGDNLDKILETTVPEVVTIATPPHWRVQVINACRSYGVRHFLCEKPIAHTEEHLNSIVKNSKGLLVYPCHTWLKAPSYRVAIEALRKNVIGNIRRVFLTTERSTHAVGCSSWSPDWRIEPEVSGGGILMDHGYHYVYLLSEVLSEWPSSIEVRRFSKNRYKTVESICEIVLDFLGGCRANITLNWEAKKRQVLNYFEGDSGSLELSETSVVVALPKEIPKVMWQGLPFSRDGVHIDCYRSIYEDFARKVESLQTDCKEFDTAVMTMKVLFDTYKLLII